MRRWIYAVTFECPDTKPPETVRGVVSGRLAHTAASRAVREAFKARAGRTWESILVLLEKDYPEDANA
jgi:hypothetical protein